MAFAFDPEFSAAMSAFDDLIASVEPIPIGDVATRRQCFERILRVLHNTLPMPDDVNMQDYEVETADGARLLLRWYSKRGTSPGSAVCYMHGGGLMCNDVTAYDRPVARYVSASGVPFLSVDYRKVPEFPYPTPTEDSYAGLNWLVEHAAELGVDPARIAVMGDSAGGGLAAALGILCRDRGGPALGRQILIYPMLDDRTATPDPNLAPLAIWTYDDNITGWTALLGDARGGPDVSPYAAPARLQDLSGLPPLYMEVGDIDIFRDEDIEYARRMANTGIDTELHVRAGVPHGWEAFSPNIALTKRSFSDRIRVIRSV